MSANLNVDFQADRRTDVQTESRAIELADEQADRHIPTVRLAGRSINRPQTIRSTDRQANRQTDSQADRDRKKILLPTLSEKMSQYSVNICFAIVFAESGKVITLIIHNDPPLMLSLQVAASDQK